MEVVQEARGNGVEVEAPQGQEAQAMKRDPITILAAIGILASAAAMWLAIWMQP